LNPSFKRVVETGYDRVAERYLASKDAEDPTTLAALKELARELPPDVAVLDLGCGAGSRNASRSPAWTSPRDSWNWPASTSRRQEFSKPT
jgi:hypothetical protein